jgi:RNA polymerase sigma-70 factor (ECF subfamily)
MIIAPQENKNFEEIYSEQYEKVYNFCLRMVSNEEIANDLTQDTFIKVFESFNSFRNESKQSTWIYSIAYNACMDYFRRKKNYIESLEKLFTKYILPGHKNMENQIVSRHIGLEILSEMSVKHRSILILKQYLNLSYEELAEIFNTTRGSIAVTLNRARKEALKIAERKGIKYEL